MKRLAFALLTVPLIGQTVTISAQTGISIATFGAKAAKITVYRALVCSSPGVSVSASWGSVEQIAEGAGVSVLDNVLVGPTAQKAENKTGLHKTVVTVGYIAMATLFAAVFKSPPPWLIEGAATITAGATLLDKTLSSSEAQLQTTIQTAMAALMDPAASFTISNGACVTSKVFLGAIVYNFKPIVAQLPSVSSAAPVAPASTIPGISPSMTIPAKPTASLEGGQWRVAPDSVFPESVHECLSPDGELHAVLDKPCSAFPAKPAAYTHPASTVVAWETSGGVTAETAFEVDEPSEKWSGDYLMGLALETARLK